jgi:hypothetical protein
MQGDCKAPLLSCDVIPGIHILILDPYDLFPWCHSLAPSSLSGGAQDLFHSHIGNSYLSMGITGSTRVTLCFLVFRLSSRLYWHGNLFNTYLRKAGKNSICRKRHMCVLSAIMIFGIKHCLKRNSKSWLMDSYTNMIKWSCAGFTVDTRWKS